LAQGGEADSAAERGREALTARGYLAPAWGESAYAKAKTQWGEDAAAAPDPSGDPDGYAAAFRDRYGLHPAPYPNDGLPMGMRKALSKDGKRVGIQIDCMLCHGGSIGGTSYVGLGNTQLDAQTLFRELTHAEGHMFPEVFVLNATRGTVNAGQMSAHLLSLRNPDLSRRFIPLRLDTNLPELDTPAWWTLGKKSTQYYDGRTDARSVRTNMQFLLGEKSLQEFKDLEPTFADIRAYLRSLKPPKYPFPIDADRAARGAVVFKDTCVRCHGTYGPGGSYPNKIVPLDVIGTDPARAEGISDKLIAHYSSTWFGQEYPPAGEMVGYQAPPLDGVWATAPYLHNGSVPTLHDLLKSSDRPSKFRRPPSTSFDHYDTSKVGWKAEPVVNSPDPKAPPREAKSVYDTSRWGLSNRGHTFGDKLSDEQREDLIEYLKTL
jgi:mono/diheme cytochrome c family protein